ncbi:hypothetical protein BDR03DRAFT_1016539 [Suillus americanus]|nr:hypothetical protein BDR03DRAFT_1016539 [Suillus americanus]
MQQDETEFGFAGVGVGLSNLYWHLFGNFDERFITLRLRNRRIGKDGWRLSIFGGDLDLTEIVQSQLIFEIIVSLIPTEMTFNMLIWSNIRMVNKLSEGRVFVAGDAAHGQAFDLRCH